MNVQVVGYALDTAANQAGAAEGPHVLQQSSDFQQLPITWVEILDEPKRQRGLAAIPDIKSVCEKLADHIAKLTQKKKPFLTIGGDHSSAIGTWSGAANALDGPLGLLWIDAHMDAHTPETSISKNIHGMSVATLLGHGDVSLTQILSNKPKINPENIALIGIRSFEKGETELLKKLNVKIYFMETVKQQGLQKVMESAIKHVTKNTTGFGISIDLDAIDPQDAPAVSTPAKGGLRADDFLTSLSLIAKHPHFIGAEIAEFNPRHDQDKKTEKLIQRIIRKLFQI